MLDAFDQILLRAFGFESGGAGAGLPRSLCEVPDVGQVAVHFDEVAQFGVGEAKLAAFVEGEAKGDGEFSARFFARLVHDFAQEAGAVFEGAAVFVGAVVGVARQEVLQDAEAMRAVEADQVEACGL